MSIPLTNTYPVTSEIYKKVSNSLLVSNSKFSRVKKNRRVTFLSKATTTISRVIVFFLLDEGHNSIFSILYKEKKKKYKILLYNETEIWNPAKKII